MTNNHAFNVQMSPCYILKTLKIFVLALHRTQSLRAQPTWSGGPAKPAGSGQGPD